MTVSKPDCDCFKDPATEPVATANMVALVQAFGNMLGQGSRAANLCEKAMPMVLELAIINMSTIIALNGTVIEMGSKEAEWETVRVLTGIEARLMERVALYYGEARKLGLTVVDGKVVMRADTQS